MVRAEPGLAKSARAWSVPGRRADRAVVLATAAFVLALVAYLADAMSHQLLSWYDLNVYNQAGLHVRHSPATLYSWQLSRNIRFTYTPFAAVVFAAGSLLPWAVLRWLMTVVSVAALALTVWLTFGSLGWRGRDRAAWTLAISSVALWTEPVLRALQLGQIELLLMALIVWDLGQSDRRWWKGAGIGVAAGIKLVPLIFIPYLVLCGKLRQAAVAVAAFAATAAVGFALLPSASVKWWLTGYLLRAGNVGDPGSLLNQSLLAVITRAAGSGTAARPIWLGVAVATAVIGLAAGALLHRSGRPTVGWLACALTGVLISPISWDHHWVWVVPVLVLLVSLAVRATGAARWWYAGLAVAVAAVYGGWPERWTGPIAFVPHGLLGFFVGPHPLHEIYHLHGIQLITWNLFVVAGVVILAVIVGAAALAWRDGAWRDGAWPDGASRASASRASASQASASQASASQASASQAGQDRRPAGSP